MERVAYEEEARLLLTTKAPATTTIMASPPSPAKVEGKVPGDLEEVPVEVGVWSRVELVVDGLARTVVELVRTVVELVRVAVGSTLPSTIPSSMKY